MNVKRIKRICGVRGCKNTESFALSKFREMGNSVIICKECLKNALDSIDNYAEPQKAKTEQKPLFYHPELSVTLSSVAEIEPEPQEVIEEATEDISISVAEDSVTIGRQLDKLTDAELRQLGMHRDDPGEQGESGLAYANKPKTSAKTTKKPNKKK